LQDLEFRQFIERVKLRSPVEVTVGERVSDLRQRGALWWARCPFHEERTPSFAVDARRGTWRCFGACGEGGDVISFVERFDGLSFLDALRLLARQCGEDLPERSLGARAKGAEAETERRHEVLRWAQGIYRAAWGSADALEARRYMASRGLADSVLEAFGVGWAPESGQALVGAARRDGRDLESLVDTGLVRRTEGGRAYDFFRGRVLIPIRDRLGRPVGFGGRILKAPPEGAPPAPKYVNTPATPLFHKGRLIFGLDLAASEVRRSGRLLIVEGYTDVMTAHQAGWPDAVAVLGTSTTEEHGALIRRTGARQVVLAFDGDEAGRKATTRALAGLLALPLELRVAVLPEGRDPGDLLTDEAGRELFRRQIEGAADWFDWCLLGLDGLRGPALARAAEERFELLERLQRPLERSSRLAELARHLGLPEADVRAQWDAFVRQRRPSVPAPRPARPAGPARTSPASGGRVEKAYAQLIGALLLDNSLVPVHSRLLEECPEGDLRLFARTLLDLYQNDESGAPIDASLLMTALGDHPRRAEVLALSALAESAESPEVLARDQARWIESHRRERDLAALSSALPADLPAQADESRELLERLHQELRIGRVPSPQASVRSP